MTTKINNIIDELKSLTLLEAVELVKQIEEAFDVDVSSVGSSSMVMMPASNDAPGSDQSNEKTDFDVILEEFPSAKKIAVLKVVRSITGLGLKEAKELVESVPKSLKEGASKEEAEEIRSKLEDVGGKVVIQ